MGDKFKLPRKPIGRRSLSSEPSGESSTDDEANEVERKVPFKVPFMRPRPFQLFDEDDSTDSEATDNEATDSEATDNEENDEAVRESPILPFKVSFMRPRLFQPYDEDDSKDSDATSPEKLEVSPKKSNDAINGPPNKKRSRRKMYTPRRFISPEAEVNQTDAKPCNNGGSKEGHSDQRVDPEEP